MTTTRPTEPRDHHATGTVVMRLLWPAIAVLSLSACALPSVEYGNVAWQSFVEGGETGRRCAGTVETKDTTTRPYFLITSRLPDCQNDPIKMTIQRGDKIRYGKFGRPQRVAPAQGKKYKQAQFHFSPEAQWRSDLSAEATKQGGRVLIYVHGYNETFPVTSEDTADIAEFTGFKGAVVHYSWPSRGAFLGYTIDENNADYEEDYFAAVVANIGQLAGVKEIVLLAHSMGARLAIPAVEYFDRNAVENGSAPLNRIILASPDYDQSLFVRKLQSSLLHPKKAPKDRKITVYTSRKDIAVGFSRILHGYARLGNPKCDDPVKAGKRPIEEKPKRCYPELPKELSGLEIIDTSISSSNNGHNDFLRTAAGCADFAHVLADKGAWPGRIASSTTPSYVWQLSQDTDTRACKNAPSAGAQ